MDMVVGTIWWTEGMPVVNQFSDTVVTIHVRLEIFTVSDHEDHDIHRCDTMKFGR
jgi:hypothetical protein